MGRILKCRDARVDDENEGMYIDRFPMDETRMTRGLDSYM